MVLAVRGGLSLTATPTVRPVLDKLLLDRGRVIVDLSEAVVLWRPVLEIFPTALAAAGGWPLARLVLTGADNDTVAALRATRIPLNVPHAADPEEAGRLLDVQPPRVARRYDVPSTAVGPGWVRSLVESMCDDCALSDALSGAAAAVATELVTNAVEHARTASVLTLALDHRGLHVAVRDHRPYDAAKIVRPSTREYRGYGLVLVDSLCRRWGVTPHDHGKTVWALLDVGPRSRF
jgi:anti-sigma regulatory factor (Ser/Thr protein kinase)